MGDAEERAAPEGEDRDAEAELRQSLSEAQEIAAYARRTLDGMGLTPEDREALWRRSDAFRELAEELRAIVRGSDPGLGS